jgi:hypothetical protein
MLKGRSLYAQPEPAEETFTESGKPEAAYISREDQRPSRYHDQDQLPDVHLRLPWMRKLRSDSGHSMLYRMTQAQHCAFLVT